MQSHLDLSAVLTQLVANLPTLILILVAWLSINARISGVDKRLDDLRDLVKSENGAARTEFGANLHRVEEVVDARLRRMEEQK